MQIASLCFAAALAATVILAIWGAGAREIVAKGVVHGHGIVKAIAPGTGALTLSHDGMKASCRPLSKV